MSQISSFAYVTYILSLLLLPVKVSWKRDGFATYDYFNNDKEVDLTPVASATVGLSSVEIWYMFAMQAQHCHLRQMQIASSERKSKLSVDVARNQA